MQKYNKYIYDGPVMEFDRYIERYWKGETMAPTESKAKSNLAYQYKKTHNKIPSTRITLPGNITMID